METLGDFIREMNFAPTLKGKIPADLLTNSVSVHDIDETDMETVETLQIEMAKWIKSVKPIETLEFTDDEILPAIHEGISRLREERIEPTILCGNPLWREEILASDIIVVKNINARCAEREIRIEHTSFYGNEFLDYSDGLYLFSDQSACLYRTDKMNAYWNVAPLSVHLIKKEDK